MDKELLTTKEAAVFLGCSVSTLHKLTMKREIEFYKPNGGKIYFTREQLQAYLNRGYYRTQQTLEKELNYETLRS